MRRDEMLQQARELARQGAMPPGPVTEPAQGEAGGVFSRSDLYKIVLPSEPFLMPGGNLVWVHALESARVVWANSMAMRDIAKLPNLTDDERNLRYQDRTRTYQVIACCRVGPEKAAEGVFLPDDAELIEGALPWEVKRRIVETCDRLGGDTDTLQKCVVDFFSRSASYLQTWLSRWSEGLSSSCREDLERYVSCVTRIALRGRLDSSDVLSLEGPAPE